MAVITSNIASLASSWFPASARFACAGFCCAGVASARAKSGIRTRPTRTSLFPQYIESALQLASGVRIRRMVDPAPVIFARLLDPPHFFQGLAAVKIRGRIRGILGDNRGELFHRLLELACFHVFHRQAVPRETVVRALRQQAAQRLDSGICVQNVRIPLWRAPFSYRPSRSEAGAGCARRASRWARHTGASARRGRSRSRPRSPGWRRFATAATRAAAADDSRPAPPTPCASLFLAKTIRAFKSSTLWSAITRRSPTAR